MSDPYDSFKEWLDKSQFILIIGKYDQILGPRSLYSSIPLKDEDFVKNLLRDALNTQNKYVILNFDKFYSQVCKINIEDPTARGKKQLYALIFLRDVAYPLIPIIHFRRIEMEFRKIGNENILKDDLDSFASFYNEIEAIYLRKDEILPLESLNLQIRSGINTIQGFCELLKETWNDGTCSEESLLDYLDMMLESCKDITNSLDEMYSPDSLK